MNAVFRKVRVKVIEDHDVKTEARVLTMAEGSSEGELIELAARAIRAAMMLRKRELNRDADSS